MRSHALLLVGVSLAGCASSASGDAEVCRTSALEYIHSGVDRPMTVTNFKAKAINEYGYNLIATFQARDRANRVFSGSGRFMIGNAPCRVIKSEKTYWS